MDIAVLTQTKYMTARTAWSKAGGKKSLAELKWNTDDLVPVLPIPPATLQ